MKSGMKLEMESDLNGIKRLKSRMTLQTKIKALVKADLMAALRR